MDETNDQQPPRRIGGKRPGAGRPPGQPNALTAQLREALITGAVNSDYGKDPEHPDQPGSLERFMVTLANRNIGLFCGLFGKSIPRHIETQSKATLDVTYRSMEEVRLAMIEAGMAPKMIEQIESYLPINEMKKPHDDESN
jgi:hypothetical protein